MKIGKLFNVVLWLLIALLVFYLLFYTFPGVFSGLGDGMHVVLYAFLSNMAAGFGLTGRILSYALAVLVFVMIVLNFVEIVTKTDRLIAIHVHNRNKHRYDLERLLLRVQYEIEQLEERIARTRQGMKEAAQNMSAAEKDGDMVEAQEWKEQGQRLGTHASDLEKSLAELKKVERRLEAQIRVLPVYGRSKRSAQIRILTSEARSALAVAQTYLP